MSGPDRAYYATDEGGLYDYITGEYLRPATPAEIHASRQEAERGTGAGAIGGDQLTGPIPPAG